MIRTFILIVTALPLGLILFLYLYPIKINSLVACSAPSHNYQESLERINHFKKVDATEIDPAGQSILMSHGIKTEKVIVFFHGFTNSPRQFRALGEKFYRLGYNVYIPRLPYHGLKRQFSSNLNKLTAEDLIASCGQAIDIASGLGAHIIVVGISIGGTLTAWAIEERHDIDKAVLIAPSFGVYVVPDFFLKPTINLLTVSPDFFVWWDSQKKENFKVPQSAYHGFSSRNLAEILRLGWYVEILSYKMRPHADSILVITNGNDHAVSREGINKVIRHWQKNGIQVQIPQFPQNLRLDHDLVDPQEWDQRVSAVYPKLLSLIEI